MISSLINKKDIHCHILTLGERVLEAVNDLENGEALDVGCGAGGLCIELNRRGWIITGIDITGKAIIAAQRIANARGSNATFVNADATVLQREHINDLMCCNFGLSPQHPICPLIFFHILRSL